MSNYEKKIELRGDVDSHGRGSMGFTFCLSGNGNYLFSFERNVNENKGYVIVRKFNNGISEQVGNNIIYSDTDYRGNNAILTSINSNYDGSMFVMSSIYGTDDGKLWEGSVEVYNLNNNNNWEKMGNTIRGINDCDFMGWDAILNNSGNTLITCSPQTRGGFGKAIIYTWNNNSHNWVIKGHEILGLENYSSCGQGIAITEDGNTVIIGSPIKNNVRILNWENNQWVNIKTLTDSNMDSNKDLFGQQIVCNNNASLIAIASPSYGGTNHIGRGKISIYKKISNEYIKIQEILGKKTDTLNNQQLGGTGQNNATTKSMDMTDDGNIFVVGASGWLDPTEKGGSVILYKFNNNNNKYEESQIFKSNCIIGNNGVDYMYNYIYCSLSSSGKKLAIGDTNLYERNGGIDIYERPATIEELKEQIELLKNTIQQKDIDIKSLKSNLINSENNLISKETELQNTKSDLQTTKSELQTTKSDLQTTKSDLQTTKSELQITKSELQTTKSELQITKFELQNTKDELQNTKAELQNTKDELQSTKIELQSTKIELQNTNKELQSIKIELQNTKNELEQIKIILNNFKNLIIN